MQQGVVDRGQARRLGFTDRQITHRVDSGRWQRLHQGVYATFSGPVPRDTKLWAATRWAGAGALLSHETAAELHGITDSPSGEVIHVTVPPQRRLAQLDPAPGIVVHRADRAWSPATGPRELPRTGVEDTVLDLVAAATAFDSACDWVARALSRRLLTADGLRAAMAGRTRLRWRKRLNHSLGESGEENRALGQQPSVA